ncbi:hypothetical protein NA56DRAFT_648411 [Hyaloscypha hepaticicola]|uniref:Uncharacterized protein n=1 Tax=Hyaloscypha hepaticicola TaxID=2082293 RepID=A0A2J6PUI1_9HELO|nr:hypothetical protein NA56DRAFT_648411 [Hyaloscypha hepaticicola]
MQPMLVGPRPRSTILARPPRLMELTKILSSTASVRPIRFSESHPLPARQAERFTNSDRWQSTLSSCSTCIAAALPVNNPDTNLQANDLNSNVEVTRQVFCNLTEADMANHTLAFLSAFGQVITTSFQSPVNFFNMTLLTAPITPFAKRDAGLLPRKLPGGFQF